MCGFFNHKRRICISQKSSWWHLSRIESLKWWQGKQGMVVRQIKGQIRLMKKFEDAPQFIILHVASNDLGCKKVGALRNEIKYIIR
jgi:hypothetical protein